MKVIIELPDNWLDVELCNNIEWIGTTVRKQVTNALAGAVAKQVKVPEIEINQTELKERVLNMLAQDAAAKYVGGGQE